jgi:hypothetical protein
MYRKEIKRKHLVPDRAQRHAFVNTAILCRLAEQLLNKFSLLPIVTLRNFVLNPCSVEHCEDLPV